MRRRLTALILSAALLLGCALTLAGQAGAAEVVFLSVNDTLQELSSGPYFSGGVAYVPYTVFTGLGLSYMYVSAYSTAVVYNDETQVSFDMTTGKSYNRDGRQYTAQALFCGGEVYLPASFICGLFGLQYSYLSGSGYGDVVRIKNGSAWLSDTEFMSAAESLMRIRYNQYMATQQPVQSPSVTVTPSPSPSPASMEGVQICLWITGLPDEALLDTLSRYGVTAGVFLTAEEIQSAPDLVRRMAGGGCAVGILCGENAAEDWAAGCDALWETACLKTVLVSAAGEENETAVGELGLAFWPESAASLVISAESGVSTARVEKLAQTSSRLNLLIRADVGQSTLTGLLSYLHTNRYSLQPLRETNTP